MRTNPDKLMATLHTYTCPAGKSFPVIIIETAAQNARGKAVCLPIGNMPLELPPQSLTLGVVL